MKGKSHKNTKLYKLKQYWYVIRQLASREIKHGNSSKKLGQLWNIINPIISMITMTFIFAAVFHRDLREFTPYVFTGIIIYGMLQTIPYIFIGIMGNYFLNIKKI